jgi:hypothetical protein
MKKALLLPLLLAAATLGTENATAVVLVNETWEDYADGATPTAPWVTWTGSPSGSQGSVTVTDALSSPFSTGTKSVLLNGTANSGSSLSHNFAATDSPLFVSFDFYLPAGAGTLPSLTLAGSTGSGGPLSAGVTLNLTNSFLGAPNQIVNQGGSWSEGVIIAPSQTGRWFHIELTTAPISSALDTYTITVTPYGGTPVTVTDLAFRNQLVNVSKIEFSWNSNAGVGSMYIDNIYVATVPEPSTALLAGACGLFVLLPRRARGRTV